MYKTIIQRICKADAKSKLRSFLDRNEPQLVQFLQTLWHNQGRAITYKELRNAILSGQLDEAWLEDWRQDYSRFVQTELLPVWEDAIQAGAKEAVRKYPDYFNPTDEGVREWVKNHAAAFVTNSTQTQTDGLRSVIRYGVEQEMSADELSRVIRPIIGLTRQQSMANVRYYNSIYNQLTQNSMNPKRAAKQALDKSIRYGQKQHRYRAYNIARTELAFAYNHGALFGIKQAQKLGLMGQVMKRWVTAADERTCAICENLDNAIISINEDFQYEDKLGNSHRINARLPESDASLVPPAHPSCRCSVAFEEVEVPMTMDDLDFFTEETGSGSRFTPENLESLPQPLTIEPVIFPGTYCAEGLPSDEEYDTIEEIIESTYRTPESQDSSRLHPLSMKNYLNEDGSFNLAEAIKDFKGYLAGIDAKEARMIWLYLNQTKFQEINHPNLILAYHPVIDVIFYNPKHPAFVDYDFHTAMTHELAHKIDFKLIKSVEHTDFSKAITNAQSIFKELFPTQKELKDFRRQVSKETNGFFADIMSAITGGISGKEGGFTGHDKDYWDNPETKEREIFANLYAMQALRLKEPEIDAALVILEHNFPDLLGAYKTLFQRKKRGKT